MIKVVALTSGRNVPSARFRIRQHIAPLKKAGIHVREYVPALSRYAVFPIAASSGGISSIPIRALWKWTKILPGIPGVVGSWTGEMTWLERGLSPGIFTFERLVKRPIILDVDDAIWMTPPFGRVAAIKLARLAHVVLAGNRYIAEWFGSFAKDVRVVPTSVDTDRIMPGRVKDGRPRHPRFTVGWTGTSSNYACLYRIEGALDEFLRNHHAELLVISDQPPRFGRIDQEQLRYLRWDSHSEILALGEMDVGLMPLPFDEWSKGKCSFKMLQYMAAGLPVVVSPVGMNAEILSMGEVGFGPVTERDWYEALSSLYHDRSLARRYGSNGRLIAERYFSRRVISEVLAGIFKEFA